jgi:hypothetical protein
MPGTGRGSGILSGSDLHVAISSGVNVHHNTIVSVRNAMCLADSLRGTYVTTNNHFHDNDITLPNPTTANGLCGLQGRAAALDPAAKNIFNANTYRVTSTSAPHWGYDQAGNALSWAAMQALGQEATGRRL